jgi:hypothetical protein
MAVAQPADAAVVWIRINSYPILATWDSGTQIFTLNDSGLTTPWWIIETWAPGPT